ncbi:Crp/Fnr family transcriptional regulator [Anaerofustis sp. NSJ-163]|uniref:Crp/Fnr family transcriptional regulator n=1 Tax=Anaerofustis sp. NSJ-163 TaxID=2944391 RepID=UPI00209BCCBC|nr:Crp/Fnr family transcriptional regulator [Anaerofustis sp. NSJ-163]MCO8193929.1 Crp/Fnr family transcriptional regulator [Anaerofustis sp. NSJ-163]
METNNIEEALYDLIPVWDKMDEKHKNLILNNIEYKTFKQSDIVHDNDVSCLGLVLIKKGKLRAYMVSESGREISLYYLNDMDICLMSASCVMKDISIDVFIDAMEESEVIIIPTIIYNRISKESLVFSNYINEIMASRFSDVMWLLEQVMFKKFDQRLAEFVLYHMNDDKKLNMTHEQIANHLGSAREVVSRMLKHFVSCGYIKLYRGGIEVVDEKGLYGISEGN